MSTATLPANVDLAELIRRHQATVWRYLRFLGCEPSLADDLTQETFLAAWRSRLEDTSPAGTGAYLRKVAKNQFLMAMRRQRREVSLEDMERANAVWQAWCPDDRPDAYFDALAECSQSINGRARQAIDLRYRDNASRAEMARRLELSEDGVKSLLRRTRELLRQCVQGSLSS